MVAPIIRSNLSAVPTGGIGRPLAYLALCLSALSSCSVSAVIDLAGLHGQIAPCQPSRLISYREHLLQDKPQRIGMPGQAGTTQR